MQIDLTLLQELERIGSSRLCICPCYAWFRTGQLKHYR